MSKKVLNLLEPATVPVCKECTHLYEHRVGFLRRISGTACSAQGYRPTTGAYNSAECKKLYTNKTN